MDQISQKQTADLALTEETNEAHEQSHEELDQQWLEITKNALLSGVKIMSKNQVQQELENWDAKIEQHHEYLQSLGIPVDERQREIDSFLKTAYVQKLYEHTNLDCGKVTGEPNPATLEAMKSW